jgi:hypothetical protein
LQGGHTGLAANPRHFQPLSSRVETVARIHSFGPLGFLVEAVEPLSGMPATDFTS